MLPNSFIRMSPVLASGHIMYNSGVPLRAGEMANTVPNNTCDIELKKTSLVQLQYFNAFKSLFLKKY